MVWTCEGETQRTLEFPGRRKEEKKQTTDNMKGCREKGVELVGVSVEEAGDQEAETKAGDPLWLPLLGAS